MTNIMRRGEDFLNATLHSFASEQVEYRQHGIGQGKTINAVIGKSFFKCDDLSGFSIHSRSIDFIISSNDLDAEPKKGDLIIRKGKAYEVYNPNNEPCWRYSGSNNTQYRIHTQSLGDDEYHPLE